jgi:hypothetical protein
MSFNLKVSGNGRNRSNREVKWFKDVNNRQIRLTHERQKHFETEHPEMSRQIEKWEKK